MAHYFANAKNDLENAGKFYQLALMLAQNYYPGGAVEIIEVFVDIGRMHAGANNLVEALKHLELINKMMKNLE